MSEPAQRIQLIEKSLRCFVYGWLSLIPVIGVVAIFSTFRLHHATRLFSVDDWNPARRYRAAGFGLALFGLLLFLIDLLLILIGVMKSQGVL
jgi:hypothetical protein